MSIQGRPFPAHDLPYRAHRDWGLRHELSEHPGISQQVVVSLIAFMHFVVDWLVSLVSWDMLTKSGCSKNNWCPAHQNEVVRGPGSPDFRVL